MAIIRQNEILGKAVSTDTSIIPRYDLKRPDGSILAENIELKLKNEVVAEGTPVNKALLDEMFAASGAAEGSGDAFTLDQDEFTLIDGAVVRCRLPVDLKPDSTLNVNGTGSKPLCTPNGGTSVSGVKAGVWMELIYSSVLDGYVIINQTLRRTTEIITESKNWSCPDGVTSVYIQVFGGGGGGADGTSENQGASLGGGGGAGGYMKAGTLSVTPGHIYPITIGAGGTAGASGGTTSFGTLLAANGGSAGGSTGRINGGTGGSGGGASKGGTGGSGDYGGRGGGRDQPAGSNGIAAAGGNGAGGSAGSGNGCGYGGGGGYGGRGGDGGTSASAAGGGGGGGYGVSGNGGNGDDYQVNGGGNGGFAAGGGGGSGGVGSLKGSGGSGGSGIVIISYIKEG